MPLLFSVFAIVPAAIAPFALISDSENVVGTVYNIDKIIRKNINLKIFYTVSICLLTFSTSPSIPLAAKDISLTC